MTLAALLPAILIGAGTLGSLLLVVLWLQRRPVAAVEPVSISVLVRDPHPSPIVRLAHQIAAPRDAAERSHIRERLIQAGWRGPYALEKYVAGRTVMALGLPFLLLAAAPLEGSEATLSLLLVAAALGYYLPAMVMLQARASRMERLARSFPNALDMLVSCLEAGLGIDAALDHVGREIAPAAPEFAAELSDVNLELRAGVPRMEALAHLHIRTGVEAIGSLVHVLSQAERYGAGISDSIRAHAQLTRRRRAIEAEKRAAKAAPKLTVVMILFIMPTLFVVLLGPSVVHITAHLMPMLNGSAP